MASSRLDLLMTAARHPWSAIRYAIFWLDSELRMSEYSKTSHKGERLVIKDWESASNSTNFTTLAHIQRYEWVLPLVKNAKVLDDGCGSGYGAYYLATHGAESLIGVDISKDAIKFAQKHCQAENLVFVEMNSCELEFDSRTFDAVIAFDVLEHIPPQFQVKFVSETERVLRPNGSSYIGCPNAALSRGNNPYHYELNRREFEEILSKYYGSVRLLGQDIVMNGVRQGRDWYKHVSSLSSNSLTIVEEDCDSAFGLLAICTNPMLV